jgi:hypothetical protein
VVVPRAAMACIRFVRDLWEQYFPIGESDEISLRDFGEDPRTTVNLALTQYRLGRLSDSLHWLDRTLALDPEHELANKMRPDVAAEMEEQ